MKTHRMLPILAGLAGVTLLVVFLLPRAPTPPSDATVHSVCGRCHLFPPPDSLPRSAWRTQIEHMAFLADTLPTDSAPLDSDASASWDVEGFVAWYESRAPERFRPEPAITRVEPPILFERRSIRLGRASGPGVSTVLRFGRLLAVPNMAHGSVHLLSWVNGPRLIGNAGHPARIAAGDLDGDGRTDLVIADLGDPLPTDDPKGRVLVALQLRDDEFELQTLVDGIGRVADVRPVDLDADGDLDLVVAAFGFLREGGVYVLHNESVDGVLDFRVERVTDRPGAVSVIPVDNLLPGTGQGFVVAFAQEHETVSLFQPRSPAGYEERVLYRAPHPAWGTSHLAATDLDRDGDLDFLLSNGDTLDDGVAFKPYHGIRWLENRGTQSFRMHPIARLYGAHAAEAADLDGDGDLDIVATAFLPQVKLPVAGGMRLDSVIWLERDGDAWVPWEIESDHPRHTGLALIDLDEDGRLDVVAAVNRAWDETAVQTGPSLEIWFNRGPR